MRNVIGDLPIVPDNHKFLAKFHSGTLRITDPMSHFFQLLLEHLRIPLNNSVSKSVLTTVTAEISVFQSKRP